MKLFIGKDEVRTVGRVRFWIYTRGSFLLFAIVQIVLATIVWRIGLALAPGP